MIDYEQVSSEKEDALLESLSRKEINPKLFPNPLAEKDYEGLKVHLYNIIDCKDMQCQQECHRRHHQFMARPLKVSSAERKNNNFGHDVLPKETINYLQVKFSLDFVHTPVDQSHPYKLKKGTIRNMKNEKLALIFSNFWLVDSYITGVLLKETIIFLHSRKSGKSYENSEEDCKKSEINLSEELRRIRRKKT